MLNHFQISSSGLLLGGAEGSEIHSTKNTNHHETCSYLTPRRCQEAGHKQLIMPSESPQNPHSEMQ